MKIYTYIYLHSEFQSNFSNLPHTAYKGRFNLIEAENNVPHRGNLCLRQVIGEPLARGSSPWAATKSSPRLFTESEGLLPRSQKPTVELQFNTLVP
jgi:hypothetical protein